MKKLIITLALVGLLLAQPTFAYFQPLSTYIGGTGATTSPTAAGSFLVSTSTTKYLPIATTLLSWLNNILSVGSASTGGGKVKVNTSSSNDGLTLVDTGAGATTELNMVGDMFNLSVGVNGDASGGSFNINNTGSIDFNAIGSGGTAYNFGVNNSQKLNILQNGNVGVGTTSPYAKLSVVGEVVAPYFTATSTTATTTLAGSLTVGSLTKANIGIGTAADPIFTMFARKNGGNMNVLFQQDCSPTTNVGRIELISDVDLWFTAPCASGIESDGRLVIGSDDAYNTTAAIRTIVATALPMDWWSGGQRRMVIDGSSNFTAGTVNASTTNATSTFAGDTSYGGSGRNHYMKVGANNSVGTTTLAGLTTTVNNTLVKADSLISLTNESAGGTLGILSVGTKTAGTSFVINSTNALDTSMVLWEIRQPVY